MTGSPVVALPSASGGKYAIFGDIHANLEALDAVLADASLQGVTACACTGDIVGYNASPEECVARVRDLGCPVVKGDSDEEAGGDMDIPGLNPTAARVLDWTRRALPGGDRLWLMSLPMVRKISGFTMVHSSLDTPGAWCYTFSKFDALASFSYQFTPVCFIGHTRKSRIYVKGPGSAIRAEDTDTIRIEPGLKYLINVGSVGMSPDRDRRAVYAIYDLDNQEVSIRRVPYDIDTTRRRNHEAGLPVWPPFEE